jgi:hypothetical protein
MFNVLVEKQSFNVHVFVKQPDDGHNRPKLVAQYLNKAV